MSRLDTISLESQRRLATRLLERLVRLLPARSRERFAEELAGIYAQLLVDACRAGRRTQLWRRFAELLLDLAQSLSAEYLDLWRGSRLHPHAVGAALLLISGFVWALIVLASAGDQAWAGRLLDSNLVLTMAFAFVAPLLTLLLSRVKLAPYSTATRATQLACTAGAASLAAWILLALHLGQTSA